MKCSFDEEVNHADGTFTHSICIQEAQFFLPSDPCYGLCHTCAYKKMKAENVELKSALTDCVREQNHGSFPDRQCAANRGKILLERLKV